MNRRERGYLLLTGYLGDPERRPLTTAQLRALAQRAASMPQPRQERELAESDLTAIGCDGPFARRVLALLEEDTLLDAYLHRGERNDCFPITRVSPAYPARLRSALGLDSPGTLWAKGDQGLLTTPIIALVGSRDLLPENADFAAEVGRQAARQGFTLLSGNARGSDRIAQESCLQNGGCIISVVADELAKRPLRRKTLYLAEDGFDLPFTKPRALSRNRVIHCLGLAVLVAQCTLGAGGTWSGARRNLRCRWTPVRCFDDGSPASQTLAQMGAALIGLSDLEDLSALTK